MQSLNITDGSDAFTATSLGDPASSSMVLFSVGSGGNPHRHMPLLTRLAEHHYVIAPHFDRLVSSQPSAEDLELRANRLRAATESVRDVHRVVGVGHSIGATLLIALAGGQLWLGPRSKLDIRPIPEIAKLVVLAPATGYFLAPGALDHVSVPILAWAGDEDRITPPAQSELLATAIDGRAQVDLKVTAQAGHFSFMDELPPGVADTVQDRSSFLHELSSDVERYCREE